MGKCFAGKSRFAVIPKQVSFKFTSRKKLVFLITNETKQHLVSFQTRNKNSRTNFVSLLQTITSRIGIVKKSVYNETFCSETQILSFYTVRMMVMITNKTTVGIVAYC